MMCARNFGVSIGYLRGRLGNESSRMGLVIYVQGQGSASDFIGIARDVVEENSTKLKLTHILEITKTMQRSISLKEVDYILVPSGSYLFFPLVEPNGEINQENCNEVIEELQHLLEPAQGNDIELTAVQNMFLKLETESPVFAYLKDHLIPKVKNIEIGN